MMFYFTPLEGIMLHHQGRNIFRPIGMYSSSSSHPDGTLFESPIRWRGKKRKLSPAVQGGGVCRVVTGVFGREQLLSLVQAV
jgi:hypothetical protein